MANIIDIIHKKQPFVSINTDGGNVDITWGMTTLRKKEKDGKLSCYIPAFDFYFSASDNEMVEKKGRIMGHLFFDHFFIHNKRNALKLLALELHKRGFKAEKDNYTMSQLVKNIPINTKFKLVGIKPAGFENADEIHQEGAMKAAC